MVKTKTNIVLLNEDYNDEKIPYDFDGSEEQPVFKKKNKIKFINIKIITINFFTLHSPLGN